MRVRALVYALLSFAVIQFGLPALVPPGLIYDHRLSYEYFRDNHADLDLALRAIKSHIRREGLEDYVILLGDSVTYSARTSPDQSIGAHLEAVAAEHGRPTHVFTLAEPSMQIGDTYAVILKLRAYGISTRHVISNLLYGGFVARTPFPPAVFWLENDLRHLDREVYDRVRSHLEAARLDPLAKPPKTLEARFDRYVSQNVYPVIAPLAYRDFIRSAAIRLVTGQDPKAEKIDPRPWTEKTHLKATLQLQEYQMAFSDRPFILDETNLQVYFLERIIAASAITTPGDEIVFFMSPVNQTLMAVNVAKPGYRENLGRVDAWFGTKPVTYLNLESAIPDRYFADHLHLTPEGNQVLAEILWHALETRDHTGGAQTSDAAGGP